MQDISNVVKIDWANRWLGGMCPIGVLGGLPVRGPDYAAHPPLATACQLPDRTPSYPVTQTEVAAAWSATLGGVPVLLAPDADRARKLLLQAWGVQRGEAVGLPANATRDLTESVKHFGAAPRFFELDARLQFRPQGVRVAFVEPFAGLWRAGWGEDSSPASILVDHSDSLPMPTVIPSQATATVYGLHLHTEARYAGALIAFSPDASGQALFKACSALPEAGGNLDLSRAAEQRRRLLVLAASQRECLRETANGLQQAAGLEVLAPCPSGALSGGVAVRVPAECDPATFYAYVRGENTPVRWLTDMRPLHYAAVRDLRGALQTAQHLARWLFVPVGPHYTDEEIRHGILGVVKAADYLGVRWRQDPVRAAEYAAMMDAMYGAGHDAYRPIFRLIEE